MLHARASAWFEVKGMLRARHTPCYGGFRITRGRYADRAHWFQYAVTGQLASLERWLEALPEHLRAVRRRWFS